MVNVFVDYHHGDLYYAIHKLFVERLGADLFRPIGSDWFHKGFWKIAEPYGNAPDTIEQYLGIPNVTWTPKTEPIQKYGETKLIDGIYHIPMKICSEWYIQKAITLEKFLEMEFDYVIATYFGHEEPYSRLVSKYKPDAIFIYQIGNVGWKPTCAKNVLLSMNTPMPEGLNHIKFIPEHHKDYYYGPPTNHNIVKSFLNCMHSYPEDLAWFNKYEKLFPNLSWKMHGILGRDGVLSNDVMPQAMRDSAFVWHVKSIGAGGFIPRQSMACGRPVITRTSYAQKYYSTETDIYEDSINCIDLDLGTEQENIEKIKYFLEPDNHVRLCETAAESFRQKIDFDRQAERIKIFLNYLWEENQK